MKLTAEFYQRKDVVRIAKDLLGKVLFTNVNEMLTGGIIVETEAYSWKEKGCHAYDNRKTVRNSIMFEGGGYAYVYLCYGMHHLFNVVTNRAGVAEAVLIRALEPVAGIEEMLLRRQKSALNSELTSGPGKLSKAMGIDRTMNAASLLKDEIWIEDTGKLIRQRDIINGPRIGIDYAGDDAKLPWRFYLKDNRWVSKPR